jgi:predicted Fe-Mo cluster-binding NifX family protein
LERSETDVSVKVLVPIHGNDVAPRFDLSTEVWIGLVSRDGMISEDEILVLPHPSAEDMCQLILNQNADVVICGGIEAEYFDYLQWKSIKVFDSVMASCQRAVQAYAHGELSQGFIDFSAEQAET